MLEKIPSEAEIISLIGPASWKGWEMITRYVRDYYEVDESWGRGGKAWTYELKFRKGGKTLCCLYAREGECGFMVIFGGKERDRFDNERDQFSELVKTVYDEARTYHDGKWMMIPVRGEEILPDASKLLMIKRKPLK